VADTLEVARTCFVRCGNRWGAAVCTNDLADLRRALGDLDAAEQGYRLACEQYLALGVVPLIPDTNRAMLLAERGEHARAVAVFRGLVPYLQGVGREGILVYVQGGLVRSLLALGEVDEAREHLAAMGAFLERERLADPELAGVLEESAGLAGAAGHRDLAARCATLARAQRTALGGRQ
jgi:tetratricopeptide (TPR) repeat protein